MSLLQSRSHDITQQQDKTVNITCTCSRVHVLSTVSSVPESPGVGFLLPMGRMTSSNSLNLLSPICKMWAMMKHALMLQCSMDFGALVSGFTSQLQSCGLG